MLGSVISVHREAQRHSVLELWGGQDLVCVLGVVCPCLLALGWGLDGMSLCDSE